MPRVIVITGTPGTGKSTLARALNKKIKGSELIGANEVALSKRLYSGKDEYGAKLVDVKRLEVELNKRVKASKSKLVILDGHLLCELRIRGATAIVLRSHLKPLKSRLMKRGYAGGKLDDNIVSEALDYCGVLSSKNYAHAFEMTGTKGQLLSKALRVLAGKGVNEKIELLPELAANIKYLHS